MCRTALTMLVAFACMAAPAAAQTTTSPTTSPTAPRSVSQQNARAERQALNAYVTYLQTLVADKPLADAAEQALAQTTSSTCKGALAPIAEATTMPATWSSTLTDVGTELGADASLALADTTTTAFAQLQTALQPLRWGTQSPANNIRRFLLTQGTLTTLPPSNLCGDALDIAAEASTQTPIEPTPMTTFLTNYRADSTAATTRLTAFIKLLDTYETPGDRALVDKLDMLAKRVTTMTTNIVDSGVAALKLALGITAAPTGARAPAGVS